MNQDLDAQHELDLDPGKLRQVLPDAPGVYSFKDQSGDIIYVGKAKSLKKRVLSYLRPPRELPYKAALMLKKATGLDFILTSSENEAFILEDTLVKKYLPRYNVVLRDDKRYPCLRLDIKSPFPSLTIVRRIKKDGALYFGPFSSANSVRSTLKLIDRVFQLRKCKSRDVPNRSRPCLNYEMDRCLGPCSRVIPGEQYREIIDQVKLFLEGRNQELINKLKTSMEEASKRLEFERAARIRDQIRAVERTIQRQHVVSHKVEDQDVIGLARRDGLWQVAILYVRTGALVGSRNYVIRDRDALPSEVMEAFLKQYYSRESFIPKQVLISEPVGSTESIGRWLSESVSRKVSVRCPERGENLRLIRMAVENAENFISGQLESGREDLMTSVGSLLKLKKAPRVVEGLDISNLYGDQAVGTVVSFVDGIPHRSRYRNYRMRSVDGIDDYGMMSELVSRRLKKGNLPDLFLVDGGRGHLAAVKKVLDQEAIEGAPEVVSIAKPDPERQERTDKIYLPNRKNHVQVSTNDPVLLFLMRVRDEAHRRAISYHRKLRGKRLTESELDRIPGVGGKRKKVLLAHFNSVEEIAEAGLEDLANLPGIRTVVARQIYDFFRGT